MLKDGFCEALIDHRAVLVNPRNNLGLMARMTMLSLQELTKSGAKEKIRQKLVTYPETNADNSWTASDQGSTFAARRTFRGKKRARRARHPRSVSRNKGGRRRAVVDAALGHPQKSHVDVKQPRPNELQPLVEKNASFVVIHSPSLRITSLLLHKWGLM